MSRVYDNWESLVAAVLRKEQLWKLCHQDSLSTSPSISSEASDSSSRFDFRSLLNDGPFDYSSPHQHLLEDTVVKLQPKLVFFSGFSSVFDLEDVSMAYTELLGRGTFGSAYTAEMDNGITIVVKKLMNLVSISEQDFKIQMEIVGNIKHENVVPLKAYFSNKYEKLLLYDHYHAGSVSALLHEKINQIRPRVDWETRLRIAIGAARGISEIHAQNGGKLVHGNIKASNIFLSPQQYGCISDVGLVNMISTTFMPTARCYAPEVKNTQNVSQESDVYSFGIFLFELLTRKSPVQVTDGHESVDLVKLVYSVKSKVRIAKVFDTDLLKHPSTNEQMVKMLQIGISCVAKSPKKRPKMSEVLKMIEDISLINIGNHVPVLHHVPAFDFKDMLRAPVELLGKGTFGTSYVVRSGKGDTYVVKKLKEVNATGKDFQQHMEIIGRIRHENIAELRAYSYTEDEWLSVYDYYNEGSVYAMLHGGSGGGDKISLDWESRLKIAVGVARGIAHIHNSKLVHGNITTSNIFLNEQKYGCVIDVGLAELVISPLSVMQSSGYCAPEFSDTNRVSQASEVYSFGIVLLELLTGKPSLLTSYDDGGSGETEIISLVRWIHSVVRLEWTSEIFDAELLRYRNAEGAMMQLLRIALSCVSFSPKLRPRMAVIVEMLHEITEPTIQRIEGINVRRATGFNFLATLAPKEFEMQEYEWHKQRRQQSFVTKTVPRII